MQSLLAALLVPLLLKLPSPFFPGILLFRKPSKTQGKHPVLKRMMVEQNGESSPGVIAELFMSCTRGSPKS